MQEEQHSQGFCNLAYSPGVGLHIQIGNKVWLVFIKKNKAPKVLGLLTKER